MWYTFIFLVSVCSFLIGAFAGFYLFEKISGESEESKKALDAWERYQSFKERYQSFKAKAGSK